MLVVWYVWMMWVGSEGSFLCWYPNRKSEGAGCDSGGICDDFVPGQCVASTDGTTSYTLDCVVGGEWEMNAYVNNTCEGVPHVAFGADEGCFNVYNASNIYISCGKSIYSCFGASATVLVARGGQNPRVMEVRDVVAGDRVEAFDHEGKRRFDEVVLVQHVGDNRPQTLRVLRYRRLEDGSTGQLRATSGHLIWDSEGRQWVRVDSLSVGSSIRVVSPQSSGYSIARLTSVSQEFEQVRNIHTRSDRIVVDGVYASCFADTRLHFFGLNATRIGPFALAPFKVLHSLGMSSIVGRIDRWVHNAITEMNSPVMHR